jgi:hypothetical protein
MKLIIIKRGVVTRALSSRGTDCIVYINYKAIARVLPMKNLVNKHLSFISIETLIREKLDSLQESC